ncbi:hypothetical protein [Streptomyces sp. enrichment culture]|uniref:hypothetical protein n=1 Tax=Streptomyces sp. enrichment culture TaxID=1795815 RepID=UPI003F54CE9D
MPTISGRTGRVGDVRISLSSPRRRGRWPAPDARVRVPRFAFRRTREGVLVPESPPVGFRAVLVDRAARELAAPWGSRVRRTRPARAPG